MNFTHSLNSFGRTVTLKRNGPHLFFRNPEFSLNFCGDDGSVDFVARIGLYSDFILSIRESNGGVHGGIFRRMMMVFHRARTNAI